MYIAILTAVTMAAIFGASHSAPFITLAPLRPCFSAALSDLSDFYFASLLSKSLYFLASSSFFL